MVDPACFDNLIQLLNALDVSIGLYEALGLGSEAMTPSRQHTGLIVRIQNALLRFEWLER